MRTSVLGKALLAVGMFLTFCAAALPSSAAGFPAVGKGDIEFQVDCASFRGPNGAVEEEFYVKVLSEQLNFERRGKKTEAHVLLAITFINELGDAYETRSREFTLNVEDKPARDDSHLLMVRYPITSAAKRVLIKLEDLRARKRGILYVFTKERKKGMAEADIEVSAPLPGTLSMSDIQFAWSISSRESEGSGSFTKSGFDVIPNPSRVYGLRRGALSIYFEIYDQTEFALTRDRVLYEIVTSLLNLDREVAFSDTQMVASSSDDWVQTTALDISKLPAGRYWLRTEVSQEDGQGRILRQREFSVLWYEASWRKSDQDVLDEASLFLDNERFRAFKRMKSGERERFLLEFWNSLDPTPGTARNEVREEFDRRVAYANAHFSFFRKGMLSDRGRIYVRYGEPDLVERQAAPTSLDAADILNDRLTQGIEPKVSQRLVGNDKRSYEVWIYNIRGTPLFETEDQMMTPTLGKEFVFVDDTGVGNYVLESSSDRSSKYR